MTVPESLLDPSLQDFWSAVARRLERAGVDSRGRLRVPELDSRGRMLLGSLLGRDVRATIELDSLEAALRRLDFGVDLADCLAALGSPVSPEPAERRAARKVAEAGRTTARDAAAAWPEAWAGEWMDEVIRAGILHDLDPQRASALVASVRAVLDRLPLEDSTIAEALDGSTLVSRTELAAAVLGDAHALDTGSRIEAATTRALRHLVSEADARDVWEQAGAHLDLVSGPVLTWALPIVVTNPMAAMADAATEAGVPLPLTQLAMRRHPIAVRPRTEVLVAENPRVVEAAAQRGAAKPMISTSGNPSHATQLLLGQLLDAGAVLLYHGDFDRAGLAICHRMARAGLQPWRMRTEDYLAALRDADSEGVRLPEEASPPGPTPWDPTLQPTFAERRRIVHEERLLDQLLA